MIGVKEYWKFWIEKLLKSNDNYSTRMLLGRLSIIWMKKYIRRN
jgi:hypothetical protein